MNYESLAASYKYAQMVCNPVDFALRNHNLLQVIAEYLIERDAPFDSNRKAFGVLELSKNKTPRKKQMDKKIKKTIKDTKKVVKQEKELLKMDKKNDKVVDKAKKVMKSCK